jgi:hypothetical protein
MKEIITLFGTPVEVDVYKRRSKMVDLRMHLRLGRI